MSLAGLLTEDYREDDGCNNDQQLAPYALNHLPETPNCSIVLEWNE